jgi:hypothetical protein
VACRPAARQQPRRNGVFCAIRAEMLYKQGQLAVAVSELRTGADKSLAFPNSYFSICSTTKRIFLVCVKEVRTTKS